MKELLFKSFWQAGFECSTHVLKNGRRLDLVAATNHDLFANQDFIRLRDRGILTAREGLRWHLIEKSAGEYDFSTALNILEAAQQQGIQLIWDVLHFGWPDRLDVFDSSWVESFTSFAGAFGKFLREHTDGQSFVAPVNEISFVSWGGGDVAYLNPFAVGRGAELKRQLVRGALGASRALRSELPGIRLVAPEPAIHIVGDPKRPDDVIQAEQYRSAMFEAWDMLSGRAQPELGGREEYLDILGVNYYDRNQWWNHGKTIFRNDPGYRPFRDILTEIYSRYDRPLFVSETGTENFDRPAWLAYIAGETLASIRSGARIHGICIYPILNHPGWDDDRHCYNGLWDYATPQGERAIYAPLADELERQKRIQESYYDSQSNIPDTNRSDLPISPEMEFCFSAAATPDEQVRTGTASVFRRGASV